MGTAVCREGDPRLPLPARTWWPHARGPLARHRLPWLPTSPAVLSRRPRGAVRQEQRRGLRSARPPGTHAAAAPPGAALARAVCWPAARRGPGAPGLSSGWRAEARAGPVATHSKPFNPALPSAFGEGCRYFFFPTFLSLSYTPASARPKYDFAPTRAQCRRFENGADQRMPPCTLARPRFPLRASTLIRLYLHPA